MLEETVDSALLPRRPAAGDDDDEEDGNGDMLTELFASKSDILLSNEYRYIFICKQHQNDYTVHCVSCGITNLLPVINFSSLGKSSIETWHTYSSCGWELLKRFSSQIKGQDHSKVKCTYPAEGLLHSNRLNSDQYLPAPLWSPVASLGLVSPGAATDGCHPIFSHRLWKWWPL